jgi:hypothetical protein
MYEFDYYIFIDYSENLIGYSIIHKSNIKELLSLISKLKHYRTIKHKKLYLNSVNKIFKSNKITDLILKIKIKSLNQNIEIFADITYFIKKYDNCIIFVSIDNNQYVNFCKLVQIVDNRNVKIVKESNLKKDSIEYKLSLIIDNLLNLKRTRKSK